MEKTLSTAEFERLPTPEKADLLDRLKDGAFAVELGAPVLADVDRIVTVVDWDDGTLVIAAQPDVPRNLTVALTDVNNSVTGLLTITGEDPAGRTVVETMEPDGAGGDKTLTGTKIFAKVTSCVITDTAGALNGTDQLVIGVGNVIGLPMDIANSAAVKHVFFGSTRVAAVDAVATGESTSGIDINGATYDGTTIMRAFVQPWRYA